MSIHHKHLTDEDRAAIARCASFEELGKLVASIMKRHGGPFHVVSGPISTGGVGTREGNLKVFQAVIEYLAEKEGLLVFSQIPFEDKLGELVEAWKKKNPQADYPWPILHVFYDEFFSSGTVDTLHFIDGFRSSIGAVWEHDGCDQWRVKRRYLPRLLSEELLAVQA